MNADRKELWQYWRCDGLMSYPNIEPFTADLEALLSQRA